MLCGVEMSEPSGILHHHHPPITQSLPEILAGVEIPLGS